MVVGSGSGKTTIASCPGKALIAGGYLVLDPIYQGFVISTPSRFYTVVREDPSIAYSETSFEILVKSPQFDDGRWRYRATRESDQTDWTVEWIQLEGSSPNSFVHLSITSALLLAVAASSSTLRPRSLDVTIVGSNDFYSQDRSNKDPIPFAALHTTIANVHKTGLGSSAAMVTSLSGALFLHLISSSSQSPGRPTLQIIHNLAQYVHSLAQGKVGSGFDVSAAVWGSQVYRRFSETCLSDVLSKNVEDFKPTSSLLLKTLSPDFNPLWTAASTSALVAPFALPPRTILILADVDAGSNTPSMVGKVMSWKKRDPVAAEHTWELLRASNQGLAETFAELTRLSKADSLKYDQEVEELSKFCANQWSKSSQFTAARSHILATREQMRIMGNASDVPIEPPEQTKLLDACCALPGVIGAGVPGAGGYDAVWVLVLAASSPDVSPQTSVERLLTGWKEMSVRPLSKNAWVEGGKGGEKGLLMVDNPQDVLGLASVLTPL